MTDNQKEIIRDMRQQGMSFSAIGDELGLSSNTIKSFCRRENIDTQSIHDDEKKNLCKNCGAQLKHHSGAKMKTFCCDKCRYAWWNRRRVYLGRKSAHCITCFHCGNDFHSNNKNRKYCGRECYIQSHYGEGLP